MKKYFLIPILTSLLFTVSCSDQLERLPIDSLVEETAFQSVSDLEAGLRGALGGLNPDNMIAFNAIFADNAKLGVDNGGQQLNLVNQILNPDTGDQGLWANRYNIINRINRVLAAAETVTPSGAEVSDYNNIVGQLRALRGYLHSELLIYYGFDITDPNALGVVYQNFVATSGSRERNTTGEVLTLIDEDFTAAKNLITSTDINFPTDDFIDFQNARIALYSGDYTTAITLASGLIQKYPLANPEQYKAMFGGDADATEVIWKFDNVQGANNSVAGNFIFTGTGGNFIEMSNGLYESFDPADVRFEVNVNPDSDPTGSDNTIGIYKYPPNGDALYINDYKVMRVSEMYLVRAEAYARSTAPNFSAAATDVQSIRTIRESSTATPAAYASLSDAIADIMSERRVELAFEGHRYLDLKRMNNGITRDARDCPGGIPCTINSGDARFIFPLPLGEINGNTNITQAPGY